MKDLIDKLKSLRTELASKEGLPPYCVYTDKTLKELVKQLPSNFDELRCVNGFKDKRIAMYGKEVIDLIVKYIETNNIDKNNFIKENETERINNETREDVDKKRISELNIKEENLILECVSRFNGEFGTNGIAKILKGSKSVTGSYYKEKYYHEAIESSFYGCFSDKSLKVIAESIDKLIKENKILQTDGLRPVLRVTDVDYSKIKTKKFDPADKIEVVTNINKIKEKSRSFHENLLRSMGYDKFYDNQWKVISNLLDNKRVLIIEKTGFGKSLCYQYLSNLFYNQSKSVTIVFSPLLSLMRDQVNSLKQKGIRAECVIGEQSVEKNTDILNRVIEGDVSILYISPERLENDVWLQFIPKMKIAFVVVDEAHCISSWGHDFRPSYRRILNLVNNLPVNFPVLAVTATATTKVIEDIKIQLGDNLEVIRGNLSRQNLQLHSINCFDINEKLYWILRIVKNIKGNGLIYCGKRADTVLVSEWLKYNNMSSCHYHGGLDRETRLAIERNFFEDKYKVIVSTNALGMGIDKKDIRFIIHFQMTENPMHYYQEVGRAGRDGKKSQVVLLYTPKDRELAEYFIEKSRPPLKKYKFAIKKMMYQPYTQTQIANELYLSDKDADILLNDLLDQNIVFKRKHYFEYNPNAPELDEDYFVWQKKQKLIELDKMVEYANIKDCRMRYLCNYLEDYSISECGMCDNCKKYKIESVDFSLVKTKIDDFFSEFSIKDCMFIDNHKIEIRSLSYYGNTEIGKVIHRCKYENGGNFPDFIVDKSVKIIKKDFRNIDLILYVPPTVSGGLVADFAHRISRKININISDDLIKIRKTESQKMFKSKRKKVENLSGAFRFISENTLNNKQVLLIDDIIDSSATIDVISSYLLHMGVKSVSVLAIAKTVKGDE